MLTEYFKKLKKQNKGYTIVETMVAISLFLVVIMTGMTALLNANLIHQKSQDMRSIIDNLSFILEDMGRNIRTGYNYKCFQKGIDGVPTGGTSGSINSSPKARSCSDGYALAFETSSGDPATPDDQWVYYVDTNPILPPPDNSSHKIYKSTIGASGLGSYIQLTPDEVIVDPISGFYVVGAPAPTEGDTQQPFIIIKLIGTINFKGGITPFSLQTSVSQRIIDI